MSRSGGQLNSEQAIVAAFEQLINERDTLSSKTVELQSELADHDLVIKTLEPLDSSRKCFRLVGEVLVERTVGEVLPAVKKNRDNLAAAVENFKKQLETKQKEVLAFQERYKIRFKGESTPEEGSASGKAGGSGSQGVLVSGS